MGADTHRAIHGMRGRFEVEPGLSQADEPRRTVRKPVNRGNSTEGICRGKERKRYRARDPSKVQKAD
jgi:hypothetical protein